MESKSVCLNDFLSGEDLIRVCKIGPDVDRLEAEVIRPQLAVINQKLGQENNARYLAYAVAHVLRLAGVS